MTDEKIVELFWDRSEKAISETENLYGRYFHYIAYGILLNDEDAKEIVNDAYLKAWNSIPPEKPKNLKGFIGRITRQLSINRLEKMTAQKRGGGEYNIAIEEIKEIVSGDGELTLDEKNELREVIERFLRSLPDEQRRIFIKRYWYMKSISQISKDLFISPSKVKSTLMRTRQKLKNYLIEEGIQL